MGGLDPQGDAGGDVGPDIGLECALRPLRRHDQVDSQRAADGGDSHQFVQGCGGVVHQHPELIDDEDQLRERSDSSAAGQAVGCEVGRLGLCEELLPAPDFRPQ